MIRTYLDWITDLPWTSKTADNLDVDHAETVLDKAHHGLDEVKDRILDHIAVLSLVGELRGPILCLVGPPGVGKTSLGQSIADAFSTTPCELALGSELQGESFAFDFDGNAYFTVSEGILEQLHRADREPPLPVRSVSSAGQWSLMGGLMLAGVLTVRWGRARSSDRVRSRA